MISRVALTGLLAASVLASGCSFRLPRPESSTPVGALDRAEAARSRGERMHPACRDERADRRDQNDGCSDVVRRD